METTATTRPGGISGTVIDDRGSNATIEGARIRAYAGPEPSPAKKEGQEPAATVPSSGPEHRSHIRETFTDADGRFVLDPIPPGPYTVTCEAFVDYPLSESVDVESGCREEICFHVPIDFRITSHVYKEDCGPAVPCSQITAGTPVLLRAEHATTRKELAVEWHLERGQALRSSTVTPREVLVSTAGVVGRLRITATLKALHSEGIRASTDLTVLEKAAQPVTGGIGVNLRRSATHRTGDQVLWVAIRNRTRAISFSGSGYKDFIDRVLCQHHTEGMPRKLTRELEELGDHVHGVGAYDLLKTATEAFLLFECGVAIKPDDAFDADDEGARLGEPVSLDEIRNRLTDYLGQGRLPYINRVVNAAFPRDEVGNVHCLGVLTSRVDGPCLLELIWSYWHEEGMLVQSINAVSRRFQNVRGAGDRDPLAHLEIDPLRPLNNLLWGYIQDEWNRLTVKRRAYEYDHHYGLTLYGKAVPSLRPADSRSKFLEGFHNLLYVCSVFFKEDNDTTVIADGYPLLNALKEVHLLLAQGAHNQFGDLPWTARAEMLIQEWLLARPEMRDFLQSRAMVPYKEAWMPQVDTMKTLQGWSDVTVTHFRDLAVYGEQILLSIRYGDWIDINDEDSAKNWARYWRPEIQGYLHAYRVATGVDLNNPDTVDPTMPSVHLQKRLASQRTR